MPLIEFVPIDIERNAGSCIQFRRDSFVATLPRGESAYLTSFGPNGDASYLAWLSSLLRENPTGCAHVLVDGKISGQIESRQKFDGKEGYVHLFYLQPNSRRLGIGRQLHDFVSAHYQGTGAQRLALTTHPYNTSAVSFYRALGWRDFGPPPGRPEFLRFEFSLLAASVQ